MAKAKSNSKPAARAGEPVATGSSKAIQPMVLVGNALAKLPSLTAAERAAFDARPSDAACETLGGKTRAKGVLDEAARWVPIMLAAVERNLPFLHYSPKRLTNFCEKLVALNTAIEDANAKLTGRRGASGSAVAAREAARAAHRDLDAKVSAVAQGNDDDEAAVAEARAPADTDSDLGRSLGKLAAVATEFLARARRDAALAMLVEEAHLSAADAKNAEAHASALALATATKIEAGAARGNDPPAVNRIEGRVNAEAKRAYQQFAEANKQDKTVPKLAPGPQLARIVSRRGHGGGKATGTGTSAGEPKGPGAVEAPQMATARRKPARGSRKRRR
jgi:hypothetical protein